MLPRGFESLPLRQIKFQYGEVPEWLKGTVLKTVRLARVSWVRIPPSPPEIELATCEFFYLIERSCDSK